MDEDEDEAQEVEELWGEVLDLAAALTGQEAVDVLGWVLGIDVADRLYQHKLRMLAQCGDGVPLCFTRTLDSTWPAPCHTWCTEPAGADVSP